MPSLFFPTAIIVASQYTYGDVFEDQYWATWKGDPIWFAMIGPPYPSAQATPQCHRDFAVAKSLFNKPGWVIEQLPRVYREWALAKVQILTDYESQGLLDRRWLCPPYPRLDSVPVV